MVVGAPGLAWADDPAGAGITWSAPPGCPGEGELRAAVARLLGRPLDRPGEALRVRGEVTREPGDGRFHLWLSIGFGAGPPKERRLAADTCAQVTDAAGVVVALAVDDAASVPIPPPAPSPSEEPPPAPRPQRPVWDLAAIGGVDVATLLGPAVGLGVGAGVDLGFGRIELRAMGWLPREAVVVGSPVAGNVSLVAGGPRYCRWLLGPVFDLAPCGGLEAGAILGTGVGALRPSTGVGRWLAPELGLLGIVRASPRFALSLALDGLALVFRDELVVANVGVVYRPPPVTLRVAVGMHLRFR